MAANGSKACSLRRSPTASSLALSPLEGLEVLSGALGTFDRRRCVVSKQVCKFACPLITSMFLFGRFCSPAEARIFSLLCDLHVVYVLLCFCLARHTYSVQYIHDVKKVSEMILTGADTTLIRSS